MFAFVADYHVDSPLRSYEGVEISDQFTYSKQFDVIQNGIFREHRCQLLYELAMFSYAHGDYRSAIFSATSAFERFAELCLHTISLSFGVDNPYLYWKSIKNQSERQLGAYLFAFATKYGCEAPCPTQGCVTTRNAVIHKGNFPTKATTTEFLKEYAGLMIDGVSRLCSDSREDFNSALASEFMDRMSSVAENPAQVTINPFLDFHNVGRESLEERFRYWVDRLESARSGIVTWPNSFA